MNQNFSLRFGNVNWFNLIRPENRFESIFPSLVYLYITAVTQCMGIESELQHRPESSPRVQASAVVERSICLRALQENRRNHMLLWSVVTGISSHRASVKELTPAMRKTLIRCWRKRFWSRESSTASCSGSFTVKRTSKEKDCSRIGGALWFLLLDYCLPPAFMIDWTHRQ